MMRHDTRKEILDTAKQLFNEHGYNNVSTRDIAEALGISKGNLTYYFKKKEEIIEALLAQNPSTRMAKAPSTLSELNTFFADIQKTVQENAFYFWHHAQLAQVSADIQEKQNQAFHENVAMLTQAFHTLLAQGLLRDEQYSGEYNRVIDTVVLAGIYWIPFCKLKNASASFTEQAWNIVFPYLTDKGRAELDAITSECE